MPIERTPISVSQLSDLLGVDPARFVAVEMCCDRTYRGWMVVTEEPMQTTGTCSPLSDKLSKRKPKKGKK